MLRADEARLRVARGAAHLDRVRPGWHDRIDVGTLTLHDACGCVVGQLCGRNFRSGLIALGVVTLSAAFGFSSLLEGDADKAEWRRLLATLGPDAAMVTWYRPLQDAWIEAIAARRHPVKEYVLPTSKPACTVEW